MTLRLRLMLIIGVSFVLLWASAALWMFESMRNNFRATLDERLAVSARMVAALMAQAPQDRGPLIASVPAESAVSLRDGGACEVRLLNGNLAARTGNMPRGLGSAVPGYSTREVDGELWRVYHYEQDGLRVTTAEPVARRRALLRHIFLAMAIPFLIAMLGGLLVLWLGIRHGLRPLEAIRSALSLRAPDQLEPLPLTRLPGEIAPLVATINQLLARTQSAIERERRFTGDAAHELRTPLTAVKAHIQVARLASGAQQASSLADAEIGVQRLQRTLEQLLMLARVEGPFSFEGEGVASAAAIAEQAIAGLPAEGRGRIALDLPAGPLRVNAPPTLVSTALRNLLENALRYAPPASPVSLQIRAERGKVSFLVMDEGPGLDERERALALRRFWRKGGSNGSGSGLGLSIVEAIVLRCGGRFQLQARAQGGTAAVLELPRLND